MNTSSIPSPRLRFIDQRLLCALCLFGVVSACGGAATQQAPTRRPGPELSGYYATRTPGQLAYGGWQGHASGERARPVNIDAYLKPQLAQKARVQHRPAAAKTQQLASHTAAKPVVAVTAQPAPAQSAPVQLASASTGLDAERYASREMQSQKQERYRGGDVVVISATTLVIVLLIILIIVLLT